METYDNSVIIIDNILISYLKKILNIDERRALSNDIFLICNNIIVGSENNVYNYRLLINTVEKFTKELENESS